MLSLRSGIDGALRSENGSPDGFAWTLALPKISVIGSGKNRLLGSSKNLLNCSSLIFCISKTWGNCVRCGSAASSARRQYGLFWDGETALIEYAGPVPSNCF